ncbi:MAG: hypothetical protein IE909_07450 [Campylobacterales bacterium]|nr:hypothetical protein [Campylobacterales bacterium]
MFTINVDKECGCFKRSAYENNMTFESKDDALMQANLMITHMNTKFCGKHSFELCENGDVFQISCGMNDQPKTGCCGGGHCS